jgi:hypothetical protein
MLASATCQELIGVGNRHVIVESDEQSHRSIAVIDVVERSAQLRLSTEAGEILTPDFGCHAILWL